MARGDGDDAVDAAHQLLGAARMFTTGKLDRLCLEIETRLREGHTITEEFALLRAALSHTGDTGNPPA